MRKLPELLAPAGSPEALLAAVEAGADAVYFGAETFSNRMRAKNFTRGELISAIATLRTYGVKSYVTVNTRLRERELKEALSLVRELYLAGADAFIVADAALARMIRETLQDADIHASTQMTGVNALDARALSSLGFSRMVCPRELSLKELNALVEASPIEIEMFVHGAHCVSVSGQCLMSWALGGRSGNRGECAQPCRLPFSVKGVKESHILSLKDMCLASHVPEIISSGVASLKLEGRLKSPDYVYSVTKIYRRLLDEGRAATPAEVKALRDVFSRDGFTDGYFTGRFRDMNGMRPEGAQSVTEKFVSLTRKVPLRAEADFEAGKSARLTLSQGEVTVSVTGDEVIPAKSAPMTSDSVYKSISKLGSTPYSLSESDFTCRIAGEVFMPTSKLNELRRLAVSALEEAKAKSQKREESAAPDVKIRNCGAGAVLTVGEFRSALQIPDDAAEFFDVIFLPAGEAKKVLNVPARKIGLSLPAYLADVKKLYKMLEAFGTAASGYVLCHTLGQILAARERGLLPIASFRLNLTNALAADEVLSLGARACVLSPELKQGAVRDISREVSPVSAIVYGKLPLMLTRRCIMSDACKNGVCGGAGCLLPASLVDRRGQDFKVFPEGERVNLIVNPIPIYASDELSSLGDKLSHYYFFADESADEVTGIMKAYTEGLSPERAGLARIKRM